MLNLHPVRWCRPRFPRFVPSLLLWLAAVSGGISLPSVAVAQDRAPVAVLLTELGRRTGTEILFDEALLRGFTARRPARGVPIERALRALLEGTGAEFIRTASGAYIIRRAATVAEAEPAIPEILVTGKRLLNTDIQRTRDDVQAYRVFGSREVQEAHRDNLDQFFRARLPANADLTAPVQDIPNSPGETRSSIDLRGLGTNRTLVLLDGRRLARMPTSLTALVQPDVNAVPQGAIERIEVITSSSGGIYGPEAIGGVVNLILRRDYEGADLTLTSGITDRGDAAHLRIEGRAGWTSADGDTQAMLFGAYSVSDPLRVGQRDFSLRAREVVFGNDPVGYLNPPLNNIFPSSDAILLVNRSGAPLTFDAEHGGGTLSSRFTYLPLHFTGTEEERRELLLSNAGKVDLSIPSGPSGVGRTLLKSPSIFSVLGAARHQMSNGMEIFVDGIFARSVGRARIRLFDQGGTIAAENPDNPFASPVDLRFPTSFPIDARNTRKMYRLTGGLIAPLPGGWRAEADITHGAVSGSRTVWLSGATFALQQSLWMGEAQGELPPLRPLADWETFQSAVSQYGTTFEIYQSIRTTMTSGSVRAGGPIVTLPGGPLSASVLLERRIEETPDYQSEGGLDLGDLSTRIKRRLDFYSAHAELRLPLIARDGDFVPLRGLELQLAARHDAMKARFPGSTGRFDSPFITARRSGESLTVGARTWPMPELMIRASYTTALLPPTTEQLQMVELFSTEWPILFQDPKRGMRGIGEVPVSMRLQGNIDVRQEKGATLSFGAVVHPLGEGTGPRLSLDYSRFTSKRRIQTFPLVLLELLAREDEFPDRVTRAPLTEEDRQLGFTAGPITVVDLRVRNNGESVVDNVDLEFEWPVPNVAGGTLTPYASIAWQPSYRIRTLPEARWTEWIGYRDGPVEWRGNGGIRWEGGGLALDLHVQYIGSFRATYRGQLSNTNPDVVRTLGKTWLSPQVYVDLAASWTVPLARGPVRQLDVRFGVLNVLDHAPPITPELDRMNYSFYGDPRRRRFELSLTARR